MNPDAVWRRLNTVSIVGLVMVLGLALSACGGGDADPTSTAEPTQQSTSTATATAAPDDAAAEADEEPTEAVETPTVTEPPADPTPTGEPSAPTTEPTSTIEPTVASEPTATTAREEPTVTPEVPDSSTYPMLPEDEDPEETLMAWLLTGDDLPQGFEELSIQSSIPTGFYTFCGLDETDNEAAWASGWLGGVEAHHEVDPVDGPFTLQKLFVYTSDTIVEAFEYNKSSASACTEWVDPWDDTIHIEMIDAPDLGDDSFGVRISSETDEFGAVEAEFFVGRFGNVVLIMAVAAQEIDKAPDLDPLVRAAVASMLADSGQ